MECRRLCIIEEGIEDFKMIERKCKECENHKYQIQIENKKDDYCLCCESSKNHFFGKHFLKTNKK